jgi:hypothetical protein
MRTDCALPIAGANQDFAVALALLAMKFVYRHEPRVILLLRKNKPDQIELKKTKITKTFVSFVTFCSFYGNNFSRCGW